MAQENVYTYYAGKRVALRKLDDRFVVRAAPDAVAAAKLQPGERMSPSSLRVTTSPAELEQDMARAREVGVTHHAYELADSSREFLITDRVSVVFKPDAVADVAVSVDVSHPWISDLRVELMPPAGAPIVLHDRAGGDGDSIVRTWRTSDSSALAALRGKSPSGAWTLRVVDVEARDEGKLSSWTLEIT